jgi:hypothetical protein
VSDKVYTSETVFTANTSQLFRTMSGLGGTLSTRMGAIGSAAGTAFSSAFTVGATAGLAALAGGAFLAVWSTKLASDAEEAGSKFGFVFGEAASGVEKELDKFAAAAGRSRFELRSMCLTSMNAISWKRCSRTNAGAGSMTARNARI